MSYDSVQDGIGSGFDKFNPKFGLQWDITSGLRLRLAWFETVKPALIANQTLEPTQVAGFNQMFDDLNATKTQRKGIGLDTRVASNVYGGLEASWRDLELFFRDNSPALQILDKQRETLFRAYLYWLPHANWALRGEYQFEKFTREMTRQAEPAWIETRSAPLSLEYFHPTGIFAKFSTTFVRQALDRTRTRQHEGISHFSLLDAALGYRLPNRRGILSMEGRNLLDEDFSFRNVNFYQAEATSPRFIPGRTIFFRVTLNF